MPRPLRRAGLVCTSVHTPLVDKQIPERNVILKETVDGEFTTLEDVAETALFLASFGSTALSGQSVVVSHGWHMQ